MKFDMARQVIVNFSSMKFSNL